MRISERSITVNGCSSGYCVPGLYDKNSTLRTICCCDTSYCNDDAFVKNCKKRAESRPKPKGITCHHSPSWISDGVINCTGEFQVLLMW